ncbi:hypothetical protein JK358_10115 [Nocardia sp. 2]|uniref:Uncharacterized protein n=1 Tax=Nocardia acididurans TaxID=2802282 RepID=A0ABS1M267_9NOCA|nr:hypothetical protein [Nocardia acididurans]MBL1074752.1 hypothetical protein [Nocardia acididurans]
MTTTAVLVRLYGDGVYSIAPPEAPTVLDARSDADIMVLEVFGGYLTWNVLAGQLIPAAVIHDADLAQEWLWAVYGEPLALALADDQEGMAEAAPALPALAVSARRLAYAHWASRWWPASTLDGIAALDQALLDRDIAALTEECESLVDGADALVAPISEPVESLLRASDYALAAGDELPAGGLILARGAGGWDWRRCPPGLVDASERAVSWQVLRDNGTTTVAISAVAAPGMRAAVLPHLRPWAHVEFAGGEANTALSQAGDAWTGTMITTGSPTRVDIYVPGFGPRVEPDPASRADPSSAREQDGSPAFPRESPGAHGDSRGSTGETGGSPARRVDSAGAGDSSRQEGGRGADSAAVDLRARVREFAAARLLLAALDVDPAAPDAPLLAEIAAAAEDSDF